MTKRILPALLCSVLLFAGCDDDDHKGGSEAGDGRNLAAEAVDADASGDDRNSGGGEDRHDAGKGGDLDGNGGSPASGNDPDLVVCIGDSLTAGIDCVGAPYPSRLAGMCGKNVVNLGVGGVSSVYGRAHVGEATSRNPGYVCILYGSNDPGHHVDPSETAANVRAIVAACKAAGCVPIVGTPPPTVEPHWDNNSALSEIAGALRAVAREEGVALVDLHAAFSGDPARYLNPADGLHFSDAGGDLVARKFDSKL